MPLINIAPPFVSVVIPPYNRSNTVGQTIDSILSDQCDFPFEIIIGDDCSTDNARKVLLGYQYKIHLLETNNQKPLVKKRVVSGCVFVT